MTVDEKIRRLYETVKEKNKMKRYKLLKDLPTFKAGDEFILGDDGSLYFDSVEPRAYGHWKERVMAYHKKTLDAFPEILEDWFEEIKRGPWKPKVGEEYWYVGVAGTALRDRADDGEIDCDIISLGNCFETKKEAEKAAEWLKAFKTLRDDTKGFKAKLGEYSVSVYYDEGYMCFETFESLDLDSPIKFATKDDAEESIKNHEREWRIFLGMEDEE